MLSAPRTLLSYHAYALRPRTAQQLRDTTRQQPIHERVAQMHEQTAAASQGDAATHERAAQQHRGAAMLDRLAAPPGLTAIDGTGKVLPIVAGKRLIPGTAV
jgi:hypothetical protein